MGKHDPWRGHWFVGASGQDYGWLYAAWTALVLVVGLRGCNKGWLDAGGARGLVILTLGGYACLWAIQSYRERESTARQSGLCPKCGYDLRASPERCPECGTPAVALIKAGAAPA
jgi:hypothetical protein